MNITDTLQQAINYMEANIMEEITYEDAARQVHMSNYHFHKIFSMIAGIGPGEYIRNRRISMAGEAVVLTERKIIDIALDYGYSTPESFSKAFSRFHGLTPMMARRAGGSLKMFNPLQIRISLEGGIRMEYRIERQEPFRLVAKVRNFDNEILSQEDNHDIPEFWKEFSGDGGFDKLHACSPGGPVYGVCCPIDKENNEFRYAIGKKDFGKDVPEGFEVWDVKPELWAVFKCIGDNPDCIGDTWNKIFTEFLPGSHLS